MAITLAPATACCCESSTLPLRPPVVTPWALTTVARAQIETREKAKLIKCFMATSLLNMHELSHLQVTGR